MLHSGCSLANERSIPWPITQSEMGDALGLSLVHVNRTLQDLRRRGLIEVENRRVAIPDLRRLELLADFDPDYLYLERRPR